MLPKPDKNKKTFIQDELPKKGDPVVAAKTLKKKRKLVLFSIIITVGLSLLFWTYRSTKNFLSQDKPLSFKLNLPIFKPNFSKKGNKDKEINFSRQMEKSLSTKFKDTSIHITDNNKEDPFLWQQNQNKIFENQDLISIKSKINSLKGLPQSVLSLDLPHGLVFQEIFSTKDDYQYFGQITIPGRKIMILIISDQNQEIPELVESLYWNYLQSLN